MSSFGCARGGQPLDPLKIAATTAALVAIPPRIRRPCGNPLKTIPSHCLQQCWNRRPSFSIFASRPPALAANYAFVSAKRHQLLHVPAPFPPALVRSSRGSVPGLPPARSASSFSSFANARFRDSVRALFNALRRTSGQAARPRLTFRLLRAAKPLRFSSNRAPGPKPAAALLRLFQPAGSIPQSRPRRTTSVAWSARRSASSAARRCHDCASIFAGASSNMHHRHHIRRRPGPAAGYRVMSIISLARLRQTSLRHAVHCRRLPPAFAIIRVRLANNQSLPW